MEKYLDRTRLLIFSSFRLVISCYLHDELVAALIIEVIIGCAFHIVVIYNRLVVQ